MIKAGKIAIVWLFIFNNMFFGCYMLEAIKPNRGSLQQED